ncbi:class I SAM-dependent methyltransferase [Fructilactobacillus florum]|uniref:rRNA methylase n=1 Tax=Fructilactobacillus florum DSM 22689 = JCM 16035 TaxID=1423745 RepID=A0A0R2CTF7_9LACO|nr:class I SAM-dependent methyltransferase [Fructilactobacillus florum]KRM91366.1 hypothetical protein FC87_GL000877 [Fructilactobacillus florum DSM 22689 = JCM 16035]
MYLKSALQTSHDLLAKSVHPGDTVVDATAGNGHDTLFLAQLVGHHGHVYSFDIQKKAIQATRALLENHHVETPVSLINTGHENADHYVKEPLAAAIFNLGYLPGADHQLATTAQTTVIAMQKLLANLRRHGVLLLVVYVGHHGSQQEQQAVLNFVTHLPQTDFHVMQYQFINQINHPPMLIAIEKR